MTSIEVFSKASWIKGTVRGLAVSADNNVLLQRAPPDHCRSGRALKGVVAGCGHGAVTINATKAPNTLCTRLSVFYYVLTAYHTRHGFPRR